MRAYRKSKRHAGREKHAPARQPLDNTQLNAAIRYVFAWMWVGMGITATVASVLLARPIRADVAVLALIIIAHFAIVFVLGRKLPRFSPAQAGAFFVFYAALTGFTLSSLLSALVYPKVSQALVAASLSAACLFGLMTLIGWRTRLDFSRARSFVLMALLGLPVAFAVNRLITAAPVDYAFSCFAALFFSALAASQRAPFGEIARDPDLRTVPTDSLRFSILLALQLYLSAAAIIPIALAPGLRGRPRLQP